jgi:hypothetical protein
MEKERATFAKISNSKGCPSVFVHGEKRRKFPKTASAGESSEGDFKDERREKRTGFYID